MWRIYLTKAHKQIGEVFTQVTMDELLQAIRILYAHRVYFTLSNPTHSPTYLHVIKTDYPKCQELLPNIFVDKHCKVEGKELRLQLSGAPDNTEEAKPIRLRI